MKLEAGNEQDSRRRKLAEVLARNSDSLILTTATPHDGYDKHFASLIQLLDPGLLGKNDELRGDKYRKHVIRRLKSHIKDPNTGKPLFQERQLIPISVVPDSELDSDYIIFQKELLQFVSPVLNRAFRQKRFEDVLSFLTLFASSKE